MIGTAGKDKSEEKQINCQRLCREYSSIQRQHPFLSVGREKWENVGHGPAWKPQTKVST